MFCSENYLTMLRHLHSTTKTFGNNDRFLAYLRSEIRLDNTILDYGCGKGRMVRALSKTHKVKGYDPAVDGFRLPPKPADVVICLDVMEHIEPRFLDEVIDHIKKLSRIRTFFSIAMRPAKKQLPDGRNAHLIVRKKDWWLDRLAPKSIQEVDFQDQNLNFWAVL